MTLFGNTTNYRLVLSTEEESGGPSSFLPNPDFYAELRRGPRRDDPTKATYNYQLFHDGDPAVRVTIGNHPLRGWMLHSLYNELHGTEMASDSPGVVRGLARRSLCAVVRFLIDHDAGIDETTPISLEASGRIGEDDPGMTKLRAYYERLGFVVENEELSYHYDEDEDEATRFLSHIEMVSTFGRVASACKSSRVATAAS